MEERRIPLADFIVAFIAASVVVFVKHPDLLYRLVRNYFLIGFLRMKMRTLTVRKKIKDLQRERVKKKLAEHKPNTK